MTKMITTIAHAALATALALNAGSARAKSPAHGATWITLGTSGGPAVQADRSQIANALVVNGAVYLFDLGNGVQRQMALAGLSEGNIKAVFVSHHHLDHNADLGPLMVTHRTFFSGVLPVIGPAGTRQLIDGLAEANAPTVLAAFPTAGTDKPPLRDLFVVTEVAEAQQTPTLVFQDENVKVWAIGVNHYQQPPSIPLARMPDALAYRVEAGGRTFVFTGDSGPSARLDELVRGADVLISEIVVPSAIAANILQSVKGPAPALTKAIIEGMELNHLTSENVGRMAAQGKVGEVVLTHFVPSPEGVKGGTSSFTRALRRVFKGKVTMARDLGRF